MHTTRARFSVAWCTSPTHRYRAATSSEKLAIQARRRAGPGSMRPKKAGLNSEISDMPRAMLPLSTSVNA